MEDGGQATVGRWVRGMDGERNKTIALLAAEACAITLGDVVIILIIVETHSQFVNCQFAN